MTRIQAGIVAFVLLSTGLYAESGIDMSTGRPVLACSCFTEPGLTMGKANGWQYLRLVIWDRADTGAYLVSLPLDSMPALDSGYDMMPSLLLTQHPGSDTLHVCYRVRQNGTDRIRYRRTVSALDPKTLSQGIAPGWRDWVRISTASTEPADSPTIEFRDNRIIMTWTSQSPGISYKETYLSFRMIGSPIWSLAANITPYPQR